MTNDKRTVEEIVREMVNSWWFKKPWGGGTENIIQEISSALTAERRRADGLEVEIRTWREAHRKWESSIAKEFEKVISLEARLQDAERRAEELEKDKEKLRSDHAEYESIINKRDSKIKELECYLDISLKSAEEWRKEALRLNNVEPPSITVPHDNLTREMRFNLCLKMIDQLNQIELDNLIRELNKK